MWRESTVSDHLWLEAVEALLGGGPVPAGTPVPGCGCERCTGIPADDPTRRPPHRPAEYSARNDDVERARAIPIVEVARRLGLGDARKAGKEYLVRCPFHDDRRPSLRLSPAKNSWYCDPCAVGGDGIRLAEMVIRCDFRTAVQELVRC
jgi:hypothetical protein